MLRTLPELWPQGFTALHDQLRAIRAERFAAGLRCPRCKASGPMRWGHFGARQRYRCRVCRRTFSDLTGSPAAYTKKLELWPAYGRCMAEGLSVRKAAARLGIDKTTAFRWRHAILSHARARSSVQLRGWVEFAWTTMAYSEKGQRRRTPGDAGAKRRPHERWVRGYRHRFSGRRISVAFACDRHGHVVSGVCNTPVPRTNDLKRILADRIPVPATLLAKHGRSGPVAILARRMHASFLTIRFTICGPADPFAHRATALAYRFRFLDWMTRFHGVATSYLPNYLVWHDYVDRAFRRGPARSLLEWLVAA